MNQPVITHIPNLAQLRQLLLEHAVTKGFPGGRLQVEGRESANFFFVLLGELEYAAWAAAEWADPEGSHFGDERLVAPCLWILEEVTGQFQEDGRVTPLGDPNTPYFALCPATQALIFLKPAIEETQFASLLGRYELLFANALEHLPRTHDYINVRGLEAAVALNFHRLTGHDHYLNRCNECMDEMMGRQYACGAQPYHTGGWIWGRRPAQMYQLLTATMMLDVGRGLGRQDVIDYVTRLLEYVRLTSSRQGEPFVTPFQGLDKSETTGAVAWFWPVAAALGGDFLPHARLAYLSWAGATLTSLDPPEHYGSWEKAHPLYTHIISKALMLGVHDLGPAAPFTPPQGIRALPDISTIVIHEPQIDACATLLTGYTAFLQADCGDVRLYAATVELTDAPTFRNAGTDAVRVQWQEPSEQIACRAGADGALLKGRVFTKWDTIETTSDVRRLHARELEVTMTYAAGELVLEFETVANAHLEPVSNRLLFLLSVRPNHANGQITIDGKSFVTPPMIPASGFREQGAISAVRFEAPDGSAIEIIPEETCAEFVLAERPGLELVAYPGAEKNPYLASLVKPAREGTLRLSFEGADTLDRGRFRIRFLPAGQLP